MRRISDRFPLVLLALAAVLGAAGVAEAWRAARSNSETAEGVLHNYAQVAAWTFGERAILLLQESLNDAFEPFWRTRHGSATSIRTAADFRRRALDGTCSCGRSAFEAAFHFRIPIDAPDPQFAGAAPSPTVAAALTQAVLDDASKPDGGPEGVPYRVVTAAGVTVVYTVGTNARSPAIWGFSLDADAVAGRVGGVMTACPLLPPVLIDGRPNDEVVAIQLTAPDGRTLFAAGEPAADLAVDHVLDESLPGIVVRASVLPAVADDLIIGGLPRSRLPLMIGVFTLAAILGAVAVIQLRRGEELARLRSDFVAGVSHELRTPLAQIRIYADTLALGRAENADRRHWSVTGLRRETTRLEHLVDNILQFARSTHAPAARFEPIDPAAVIADAVEAFRPLAGSRATLDLVAEHDLRICIAREGLRQVVGNLLDNALKYGPKGQVVRVRVARDRAVVRIIVDDEGRGVDPAERAVVWEMYRRGRHAAAEVGGTGVGLAIVRRIVEGHGGRTHVEDAPSGGARFVVELPIGPEPSPPRERPPSHLAAIAGD